MALLSGAQPIFRSVREINNSIAQIGFWLGPASAVFSIFFAIAADPNGCIGARGGASVGPEPELQ